jgi:diadenosine tetraphosphate (Ap4A) HIT family hydrolase
MDKKILSQLNIKKIACIGCELQAGHIESIGGIIASTKYFEARQDYAIPIPGFVIISSKRHMQSIDEFTPDERHDFIDFVCKVRGAMRNTLGIETVYLIQEEDATHFHLWLFPRYDWMKQFGKKIKSVKPIMRWAIENLQTPENLQKVKEAAEKLKKSLNGA